MAEMVKLFVNGREVEVESGKNLIDAFKVIGIEIPHFCYHPALGADGNCRMCLVGIEDGRPPLVPACKTPVAPGLKVQLDTEKIKKIQHDIMEFELINHPIDCPVCDQAGECTLQDYYMSYDLQDSRMTEPVVVKGKRMDFGCGVVHDQERCVLCARCVRFTRLITKTGELGIVNRSDEARVETFPGRPLNNRYAVNVVDLCPVGAMTSRDFRFTQRAWFLTRDKGICHGCAKGCNIYIDHNREKYKDDVIYRFRPRLNEQVNGYFICDEGRFTYHAENEGRLMAARVDGKDCLGDYAAQSVRAVLGPKSLILVSPDSSLEQMAAIKALSEAVGARLSGYSEGYIKEGDGDNWLIQDDKSANRAGLSLLGIDAGKETFTRLLNSSEVLVSFDNDLFIHDTGSEFRQRLEAIKVIAVTSHDGILTKMASIAIPVASYSESSGSLVNIDGMLQHFDRAVQKNTPYFDMVELCGMLGSPVATASDAVNEIKKVIPSFANVEGGLKLTASEATNVPA
ncbi:MAG: 2Fe-2S iron-sulfur cluster-binding protein [Desulfocapsaceae bacterium]|nr:2Fe-2S iron-sulfur cluster-binding protein [Desulfocapsaceae bacterium]